MVRTCIDKYNDSNYNTHFELFPYELSDFQKYAIQGIVEGNHVLVTAHTGSGKTLPAEFAIQYFTKLGKKSYIHHQLRHYRIKNSMNLLKSILIFHLV
jgi:superfamily II RNA helicase